jgi:UDP-N-acetylbacillosamine N-acetyltransferase
MSRKVAIWGAGGHALVVADIIRAAGVLELVGFLDDTAPDRKGEIFGRHPVLGGSEQLATLRTRGVEYVVIAVGDCATRVRLAKVALAAGFRWAAVIHPNATIGEGVEIGDGSVVVAGAVINPIVRIGENVIINTCASVDHECLVGSGAHLSPGVRLGGGVQVGPGAWIGMGAIVLPKIKIGAGSVIGAGAVVVEDIPEGVVAYGVPAKVQRKVEQP